MSYQHDTSGVDPLPIPRPLAATINFAFLVILSVILLNAAATIATVTYLGSVWGTQVAADLTAASARCLEFFCLGMFAAMVSSGSGYIAQLLYGLGGRRPRGAIMRGVWAGLGIYFHCMALLAAALGVIGFAWGAWNAIVALTT